MHFIVKVVASAHKWNKKNKKIVSKYKFKRKGIWIHYFEIFSRTKNINYFYSISQVDLDLKMSIMCEPKNFLRILRKNILLTLEKF